MNELNEKSKFENIMSDKSISQGISIKESIKLFFKINIFQVICAAILVLLFTIPVDVLAIWFKQINKQKIYPYIKELSEVLAYIYIIRKIIREINLKESFKLKVQYKPKLKEYFYVILIVLGYRFVYSNTLELLIVYIPVSQWVQDIFNKIINMPILLLIISSTVVAPIFEETIYRGIILEQLYKKYGMWKSIIISALFFGVMHLNIHQGINGFFIGIVLGFIYVKTNSLVLSIFLHFVNNLLVVLSIFIPFLDISDLKFNVVQLLFGTVMLLMSYKFFNNIKVDLSRRFNVNIKFKIRSNKGLYSDYNSQSK